MGASAWDSNPVLHHCRGGHCRPWGNSRRAGGGSSHAAWTASSSLPLLHMLPCRTVNLHADLSRVSWWTETLNKYWMQKQNKIKANLNLRRWLFSWLLSWMSVASLIQIHLVFTIMSIFLHIHIQTYLRNLIFSPQDLKSYLFLHINIYSQTPKMPL